LGLGIGGDQVGPRPEGREVATDGTRFEQLEAVVLLLGRSVRERVLICCKGQG
jgi:hypothetical protein